jgi:beta-phosphoglucomutase-like phosphatase (HAD superfamily)
LEKNESKSKNSERTALTFIFFLHYLNLKIKVGHRERKEEIKEKRYVKVCVFSVLPIQARKDTLEMTELTTIFEAWVFSPWHLQNSLVWHKRVRNIIKPSSQDVPNS